MSAVLEEIPAPAPTMEELQAELTAALMRCAQLRKENEMLREGMQAIAMTSVTALL